MLPLPNEVDDYHGAPGLRWSLLKHMRVSPLHLKHAMQATERKTEALLIGDALHCAVLEPEKFADRFVTYTDSKTVGEGSRKRWMEFKEQNRLKLILDVSQYEQVWAIASAILQHDEAKQLLSAGRAEVGLTWQHPSGLRCKSKIDWLTKSCALVELKTALEIGPHQLGRQAWNLGYFHQLAYYRMALAASIRTETSQIPVFAIAAESGVPHDIGVLEVDQESLQVAEAEVDDLIHQYLRCTQSDAWPGQYPETGLLRAPSWALADEISVEAS